MLARNDSIMLFLIKKTLLSLFTLVLILGSTFSLLHLVPGGPFDQERHLPPEIEKNLYEKYHLEKRGNQNWIIWVGHDLKAYLAYLKEGSLGPSLQYRDRDVTQIILNAYRPSLILGLWAFFVSLGGGLILGALGAAFQGSLLDHTLLSFCALTVSLPRFVMGVILVLIFSLTLGWLPPALWEGGRYQILPVMTLALSTLAYFVELIRSGLIEQLKKDYIRTAQAKGVPFLFILLKHALKNSLNPVLHVVAPVATQLIAGSFIVETLFGIPGLGRHFVMSINNRDYFLVMGITCLFAVILITLNLVTDALRVIIDPKSRSLS